MAKRQRCHAPAASSATTAIAAAARGDLIARYRARISGPLIDRIDLQIEVPALLTDDLVRLEGGEASAAVRSHVERARDRMCARQGLENARLVAAKTEKYCPLDDTGRTLLKGAIAKLGLSGRAYHRVLKVARTIADLAGENRVLAVHLAEAVQYRKLDRGP